MKNHNIKTYQPQNILLEKYIDFYYEYELVDEEYFAFPAPGNVVALMENTDVFHEKDSLSLVQNELKENHFFALNKYTKPLFIKTKGRSKEFVIAFKPYGLAQFVNLNIGGTLLFDILEFNVFIREHSCFFEYSIIKKIREFELFLLSILNEKKELSTVVKSVDFMQNDELTIQEIAKKCNCSYKKLYRLFKTHCGTTPIVIKKNIRFRNALKKIKNKDLDFKLSDVAIDLGYYDQAIFNKAFKQLTGESPKQFFKNVSILSERDMYFKSLK